jgi:putative transposase
MLCVTFYVDGVIFGNHHVLAAVGVDREGCKHVLGLAEGASENEVVARGLLEDLVQRGVKADRKYLLVIDGSKALRGAIDTVFGAHNPVQRCRHHKIENVVGYLSDDLKDQVKAVMRAAFRLPKKDGMAKLEKQAEWLDHEYPSAATSLREGLEEMFTVNTLGLTPNLARCLSSTNIIESSHSGLRLRTRRVCHWQNGKMVLRWGAAALLMTEKHFRKIMGYKDLWMLESALERKKIEGQEKEKVA